MSAPSGAPISASPAPRRWLIVLAFAAVYLIWGSSYIGIHFAVASIPPFVMSGLRFTVAGLLLVGWSVGRGAPLPNRRQWMAAAVCGFFLFLLNNGGLVWAQSHGLPSSVAALLIATTPFWVVLITWLRSKQRPPAGVLAGVVIGFGGLGLLINPFDGGAQIDPLLAIIVVLAALAWVIGGLYGRGQALPASPILSTGMQLLTGGVMLMTLAIVTGELGATDWAAITPTSWVALVYLGTASSIIAFSAFIWLMRVVNPATVATYAYVNPVIALVLGAVLANEVLETRSLLAAVIIIGSVIVITRARGRAAIAKQVDETAAAEATIRTRIKWGVSGR